jgi:Asp-tRNA(Asn)/Glu-tRNA(Gln) amidotransferase A subunit family amidase
MKNINTIIALSAYDAARALQSRELSAQDYVGACLERIAAREPEVKAFAYLNKDLALARAKVLDEGAILGPLHGLTLGVKDVFDTWDMPTQGGSDVFAGYQPIQDAACLATVRSQGMVLVGKTITTELATFPPNGTRNPLNLEHTPGGSSSGSAAAVADHMVSFATGTQTMGSTVRPSGYCGVTGYKPSYNLIPRRGVWANADSCDTVGLVARDVRDVALLASAMLQYPGLLLPETEQGAPVIGICRTFEWERADGHIHEAFADSARRLAAAGAKVVDIVLPEAFRGMRDAQAAVVRFEMGRGFADIMARHGHLMRKPLYDRTAASMEVSGEEYQRAQTLGRRCRQMFTDVLGECDVLFVPGATGEAPKGLDYTGDTSMNQVWTFMHGPCLSVRGGTGPNGLPLAMQVVGRLDEDARTLRAAHWIDTCLKSG